MMKSNEAIWLSEVLKEFEGCKVDWRVIKKYADDWEKRKLGKVC
jgi:hypothetical protein